MMDMRDYREVFSTALTNAAGALGLRLEEHHLARMWRHFELVVEANRRFNLTRITAPADAALKHYADSLALLATRWVDSDRPLSVLDVGTGAGFPAVPLAIVCERWGVMAIDGTGKKARFVAEAAAVLGLANLEARHTRAADLARAAGRSVNAVPHSTLPVSLPRKRSAQRSAAAARQRSPEEDAGPPGGFGFDLIVMRAVAQLAPGIEEVHSLVNAGGAVVFYKGGALREEELTAGAAQARRRSLPGVAIHTLQLPSPAGPLDRQLIRYARKA